MADYCRALAHRLIRDMRDKQKWFPVLKQLMVYAMYPAEDLVPFWDASTDPSGLGYLNM